MPNPKRPQKKTGSTINGPALQIILEKIESANCLVIETVNKRADAMERRMEKGVGELRLLIRDVAIAARLNSDDIRGTKSDVSLEDRVSALERRPA